MTADDGQENLSRFMSLVLRHRPQDAGLTPDPNGWVSLDGLIAAAAGRFGSTAEDIRRVVATSDKRRFEIDGDRIRAVQGHSIDVDPGLVAATPPEFLWHGTTVMAWKSIRDDGLTSGSRTHVHLSADIATAVQVARRRPGPHVVLKVLSGALAATGHDFLRAANGVWLTRTVPPDFILIEPGQSQ